MCRVGDYFMPRELPPPGASRHPRASFARLDPTRGRDKKELPGSTSNFKQPDSPTHTSAIPRRVCARVMEDKSARTREGVGNAGCSVHPQPRVGKNRTTRASSPWVHRIHPAFPHAMVLTVSFELFPVIGPCCHRRLRNCFRKLERQRRGVRTTRLRRPLHMPFVSGTSASIASRPASVTIACAPGWGETARVMDLIWGK